MKKILTIGVVILAIVLSIISATSTEQTIKQSTSTEQTIKQSTETGQTLEEKELVTGRYWGSIENGSIRLTNNIWGATDAEKENKGLKSYIYYKFNGSFGWEWNRPDIVNDPNIYTHPIYPEVVVGSQPGPIFVSESTTPDFPIKLKDIKTLSSNVEYKYVKTPTGLYNLAYDIWLVDGDTKKAEIMVWIYGNMGKPNSYISDGIDEYGYFYRPPGFANPTEYYAFVLRNQNPVPLNHKVDIKKLLDFLSQSGKLNPEWEVLGIELGNEIGRGSSGRIEINKFKIILNGKEI